VLAGFAAHAASAAASRAIGVAMSQGLGQAGQARGGTLAEPASSKWLTARVLGAAPLASMLGREDGVLCALCVCCVRSFSFPVHARVSACVCVRVPACPQSRRFGDLTREWLKAVSGARAHGKLSELLRHAELPGLMVDLSKGLEAVIKVGGDQGRPVQGPGGGDQGRR